MIYSYIIPIDDGAAPNPFWGMLTLAICKPAIRKSAQIGDWVIGTGSSNKRRFEGKYGGKLVYAMRVSEKLTFEEYNTYCSENLKKKIPNWRKKDWRLKAGDCIYYPNQECEMAIRQSVHNETNRKRDLSGEFVILSNEFYYFGDNAIDIPGNLKEFVHSTQGHKKVVREALLNEFEEWMSNFEVNKLYGEPQLKEIFLKGDKNEIAQCQSEKGIDDDHQTEVICS